MTLTDQIRLELIGDLQPWVSLLGEDATERAIQRIEQRAPTLASQMTSSDERMAAQTVIDVMACLGDRSLAWWTTPLGQVVARSTGSPLGETVSYSVAGAMLGLTRQRIPQLVAEGRLETDETGSVRTVSVLEEALRRAHAR